MDSPLVRSPIYQQLNDRLRLALANDYQLGDQFLTEREISLRFQVSRPTANKALAGLVSEGLLEFRKGLGTFVSKDLIAYDVRSLVSFTEKAKAAGKKPSTILLMFRKLKADAVSPEVIELLQTDPKSLLWQIERIRLADNTPVILEHRYVVHRYCPRLTKSQVEGSLYRAWTDTHSIPIAGADETIRAVLLTETEAKHLRAPLRSPALEVSAVGFIENNSPLWWERTLYRGDHYEFQSHLGPIRSATPAKGVLR